MKASSWKNRSQVFIATILLIAIWEIAAKIIDNSIYLPTVETVVSNLGVIVRQEDFFLNIYYSMYRTVVSFFIALILALITGVLSSFNSLIKNMLKPINALATSIPTMILVVLSLIWFDKNNAPYIVGIFIVFPLLYDAVISSIGGVDKNIVEMAKVYKVNKLEIIRKIYFPAIKFQILGMFISSFSLAFKVVIAGEVHGQPEYGIGTVIQYEKMNFNTEAIFAWIVIIALISFALERIQTFSRKSLFRWMA
ncbi:ABC transporter permease [Metaclostridioides mangenotii]|uniref:NitT/TauT family transport system permease protein n=1 Tax=Metaclostridioides mangenotii TaxID=1540 RepID=A0ABS4EC47_9FIRM|nr:ABC transporter permease subunit [Clostridioides mangenotii]MBP1855508.1 NitT/TauT family transport system permease protein [Clostridioides mangenotii]